MSEFRMPSLGADMEAGILIEWMKRPGDPVQRGEAIAAVETQKGAVEIESFETGVLERTLVDVGAKVPVGTVMALIRAEGEASVPAPAATPIAPVPQAPSAGPPIPARVEVVETRHRRVSPAARQRAEALGLDLDRVPAAADGVVGLTEVEAWFAQSTAATSPDAQAPMRSAIAAAMTRSWREIPHYYVSSLLDCEPLLAWLAQFNAGRPLPQRLHYATPLIKAVALALRETPELNGHFDGQRFISASQVHLGIAIALRSGGLVAPAIADADRLGLDEVASRLNGLVERVRGNRMRGSELGVATATLSMLGEETADALQPLIAPPQVAIIGCGRIAERAWADGGKLSARRCLQVTVGGDHRVSDGRRAAQFLQRLNQRLQQPEQL